MPRTLVVRAALTAAICAISLNAHAIAQSPKQINVAGGELVSALESLARQTDISLVYQAKKLAGTHTNGVRGNLTPQEAVIKLLEGTQLRVRTDASTGAMFIEPPAAASQGRRSTSGEVDGSGRTGMSEAEEGGNQSQAGNQNRNVGGGLRVAQADQNPNTAVASAANAPPAALVSTRSRDASSTELEEIVVSARKMKESLFDVPVIETAVTGEQLQKMQTLDLADLQKSVTGLTLGHSSLAVGTLVSIRGVGTSSTNLGVDQSVSLNIDGLALGQGLAYSSGLFDLEQIEVLKGPQALFFGKSTTGGVISLRTADPVDKLEVIGNESYEFEARTNRQELIVSGPVTDTLKLRLSSMYSTSDGYFRNVAVAVPSTGAVNPSYPGAPDSQNYLVRGTALWDPSSQFSARLKVNYVEDDAIASEAAELTDCPEGPGFSPFGIAFIGGVSCKPGRNLSLVYMNPANFPGVFNNGVPFLNTTQKYGSLEMNYRPGRDLTVTSVTAYYSLHSRASANATETSAAAPAIVAQNNFGRRELTEEVRLTSDYSTPVNFTVGGYYENGEIDEDTIVLGNSAYRFPALISNGLNTLDIRTYSAFGQLRWKIVPRLEFAAGLRWAGETRRDFADNLVTARAIPLAKPRIAFDNISPEGTLTYRPTDDLTAFAALKQAYKSGSYNISTLPTPGSDNSFGDEKAQGGELGVKTRWLNRQLSLDLAAYYYHFEGLQVGVNTPSVGGAFMVQTTNSGSASTYGLDFDSQFRPAAIDGLGLHAAVNWNRARYLVLNSAPCWGGQTIAQGCNQSFSVPTGLFTGQNLSGTPLPRAPQWQFNAGFDYEIPVGRNYTLDFANNNAFSSRYVTFIAINRPNDDNYQPAFFKSDVSLSLKSPDERWVISLVGKNINDKITTGYCVPGNYAGGSAFGGEITGGTAVGRAGVDQVGCFMEPGREVWLKATLRPFASID